MTFTGFTGSNLPALLDDFNRADNVSLSSGGPAAWREGSDDAGALMSIVSNRVGPDAANATNLASAFYDGIESNHIGFAFTMPVIDGADYAIAGCVVTADAGNGINPIEFFFTSGFDTIEVYYDNSTLEATVALSATFVNGDQAGFDVEDTGADNVYKFYRRAAAAGSWSLVGTHTDTAAARGGPWDPGFGFYAFTTARIDDFYAEAITASGAAATPQMMLTGAGA